MATTTGLTYEQLAAKISALKAQGKTESTSKELGKYVNAQMLLKPAGFSSDALKNAQAQINMSTQTPAGTSGSSAMSNGSSGLGTPSGSPASIDLNKIYESAMTSPELVALEKQLADKQTARTTAETNINDNPWYSEATRVGKIAKLTDQSQREIEDIQSQVAQKKADAQVKVNIASQQYNIEDKNYQNQLQKLNLLISSGALLNASGGDIASIATATGMSTSMVTGMINQMKENKVKPSVITSTNDAGVVTVSVVDANTGKVISQNSLGAVGNAQTGTKDTTAATQEKAFDAAISDGISQLQKGESWGTVWQRVHARFPDVPALLIDTGLGTEWQKAGAYESWAQKVKGGS
jgi:hypothetical protein